MRRFPAGVAIVGVDLEGERLGLTIGTLIPLSLEPPLAGPAARRGAAPTKAESACRSSGPGAHLRGRRRRSRLPQGIAASAREARRRLPLAASVSSVAYRACRR